MRNSRPRRGLHSMRTRATRKAVASLQTPELYLKLTSLEIERSRRAGELEYLLERVHKLQTRIRTIVEEQEQLQSRIAAQQTPAQVDTIDTSIPNQSMGFTY